MIKVTLELNISTPMLVGWYEPRKADPEGLRAAELKGIWRYWVRATVAGALYDKGMLVGEGPRGDVLRRPSEEEGMAIACYTGKIMGLGYAGSRDSEQSRFRIKVEPLDSPRITRFPRGSRDLQRVSLLTIKEDVEKIDPGARFNVAVEQIRSRYRDAEELAIKILILSLQIQGVGKGGRRGLGSLDLRLTYGNLGVPEKLRDLVEEIYSEALDIVTRYRGECFRRSREERQIDRLPPLPAISKRLQRDDIPTFSICSTDLGFNDVHNFFIRTNRCRVLLGNPVCRDRIREEHVGWFLGLPRTQRGTGYIVGSVERRSSPMYVGYHGRGNMYGAGVYIAFSLSADWPLNITWRGAGRKSITVNDQEILRAYSVVYSEFEEYVKKLGKNIYRVWP